jgi:hypothetical protein
MRSKGDGRAIRDQPEIVSKVLGPPSAVYSLLRKFEARVLRIDKVTARS